MTACWRRFTHPAKSKSRNCKGAADISADSTLGRCSERAGMMRHPCDLPALFGDPLLQHDGIGRVEDIAHAVAFLASPVADFIDGANLRVDGGYVTAIN